VDFEEILKIENDLEFLREVHQIFEKVPPFKFWLKKIEENEVESFRFNDVKKTIVMDWANQEFFYPEFDERKEINLIVFSKDAKKPDRIIDGGLRKIDSLCRQENFGIIRVNIKSYAIDRNERNLTHLNDYRDWEHEEFYLWDYSEEKYVKVPEVKKQKKKAKGKEGEDESGGDPKIEEFKKRTELIPKLLHRARILQKRYFVDFDFIFSKVPLVPRNAGEMISFLADFHSFLGEPLEKGLITRLVLNSLDLEEFKVALQQALSIRKAIAICQHKLSGVDDKNKDFTLPENRSPEENVIYHEYESLRLKSIQNSFSISPENPSANVNGLGYFVMETTSKKLFPNFSQIEKRRYRTQENITPQELEDNLVKLRIRLYKIRMDREREKV
jgi:hypothetical protein